jgi:hypothetical protein
MYGPLTSDFASVAESEDGGDVEKDDLRKVKTRRSINVICVYSDV